MKSRQRSRAPGLGAAVPAWAAFFISGAAGLIFEMCWIRRAALAFGSDLHGTSTVLAIFFLGLAIGGHVFGEISRRVARPLRLYAILEIAIAALALLTLPGFGIAETAYSALLPRVAGAPALRDLLRVGMVAVVLLPPTFLLGGTLPLFCRRFVEKDTGVGRGVGFLYGLNTLGAAAGCLLAGFVLLPGLGRARTLAVGAACNVVAALLATWLARDPAVAPPVAAKEAEAVRRPARPVAAAPRPRSGFLLALVFLAGLVALGQEVLWTRFLGLVTTQSVTALTLMLASILIGIVLGSLLAAALVDRWRAGTFAFGVLQAAAGLVAMALMFAPPPWWKALHSEMTIALLILVPSAACSGALLPLAARLLITDATQAGAGVGRIVALNTLGGITGSLLMGFWVLPRLGLETGARLVAAAAVLGALATWIGFARPGLRLRSALAGAVALAAWLLIPRTGTRLPQDYLGTPESLVAWREGLQCNLAVVRVGTTRQLEINRWWQGSDRRNHQVMAAHVPMLLHPNPRRVLVLGVGSGQAPARFMLYPTERVDCVDIEPAVFDIIRECFDSRWLDDPRAHAIRDDGRSVVRSGRETWDVISVAIGPMFRSGAASFYTADFYRLARARLAPGGLVSQSVSLDLLTPADCRSLVATFRSVFPGCVLWYNTSEVLLIGGRDGAPRWEAATTRRIVEPGPIHDDLQFSYWGGARWWLSRPEVLLGGFLCGPSGLERFSAGAPILTDDGVSLDFAATRALAMPGGERAIVAQLRNYLEAPERVVAPGAVDSAALAGAVRVREVNLAEIAAAVPLKLALAAGSRNDDRTTVQLATAALAINPEDINARLLLASAHLAAERWAEAAPAFEAVVAADSSLADGHRGLGYALHRLGRRAEAVREYRAALALQPRDAETENRLGVAYAEQGDMESATRHFRLAIAIDAGYSEPRKNLARALGQAPPPGP